jgi:hypothetical protein
MAMATDPPIIQESDMGPEVMVLVHPKSFSMGLKKTPTEKNIPRVTMLTMKQTMTTV